MSRRGFTLIELLVVVAIVAVLAAIAIPNFFHARERAWRAADAANLHVIGGALNAYFIDYGDLPPADTEGGPYSSSGAEFNSVRNGPAAGGSLDGIPWVLYERRYVTDWRTLFCPYFLKKYEREKSLKGNFPRYHNFRYAYNSAGLARGGNSTSGIMSGLQWLVRDLSLDPRAGFFAESFPEYPADFTYPWDGGKNELALYADMTVRLVAGGTDDPPLYK